MRRRPRSTTGRTRERRRSGPRRVLRRPPSARLFSGVRRPLARALAHVAAERDGIERTWRCLIRRLDPGREEFLALAGLELRSHWRLLRVADYDAYVEATTRDGQALAGRGIPDDHAVLALASHLESCLAHVIRPGCDQKAPILSLVRLTGAVQKWVLAGYARARAAGWHQIEDVERKKLSRDLHDDVGADLVVLKLYIEMISIELRGNDVERARAKLEEALALVSHALESVRRLTLDLGPALLEHLGLVPAVRLYCRHFSARTGIAVSVQEGEPIRGAPPGHETTLYRLLQGALSNVAKHARAGKVQVAIGAVRDAVVVMTIEDDGVGFDVERQTAHGAFGLTAMRERVQSLGGRLHITSRTARSSGARTGTRIEIDLPIVEVGGES